MSAASNHSLAKGGTGEQPILGSNRPRRDVGSHVTRQHSRRTLPSGHCFHLPQASQDQLIFFEATLIFYPKFLVSIARAIFVESTPTRIVR
jgi:hypothetical protein